MTCRGPFNEFGMHEINVYHLPHQFAPDRYLNDVANLIRRGQYPVNTSQCTHNHLTHRQHRCRA